MTAGTVITIRRLLFALVSLAIIGTSVDLLLLAHYEDTPQLIPLALNAIAAVTLCWHLATSSPASVRSIQAIMIAFVVAGIVGIYLHYQGNLEFQIEMDPSRSRWELFKKVVQAKAPPALAPATMAETGLLGLIFAYRHPALGHESGRSQPGTGD
jgi:hypothetical protein